MSIQRYTKCFVKACLGDVVLYSDHLKEIEELNNIISIAALNLAEKDKEIKELEGNLLTMLEEVLDRNKRIDELREGGIGVLC